MMLWGFGGIFGYAAFGFIADVIGRRLTIPLYNLGTLPLGFYLFLAIDTSLRIPTCCPSSAFSCSGSSPATPCICRSCSRRMCGPPRYRSATAPARIITSFGPLLAGLMVAYFGGLHPGRRES